MPGIVESHFRTMEGGEEAFERRANFYAETSVNGQARSNQILGSDSRMRGFEAQISSSKIHRKQIRMNSACSRGEKQFPT